MIDAYLQSKVDVDDRAIHLLFAANRWEQRLGALDPETNVLLFPCTESISDVWLQ